jgi:predicted membrane channel-forming protein YqfA (hemolysin III family)
MPRAASARRLIAIFYAAAVYFFFLSFSFHSFSRAGR